MFYAMNQYGERVHISRVAPEYQYLCPACHREMIVKDKGELVAHHFAHKSRKNCDTWYRNKMSKWHYDMQNLFPESTREVIVHNEDQSEFHVADVLLKDDTRKCVFEFQHSSISIDEFLDRSSFYLKLGYSIIWVFDFRDANNPKYLYYEDVCADSRYRYIIWPGKDRIRLFDSHRIRSFLEKCMDDDLNVTILFHVYTGPGRKRTLIHSNGFEWIKWEYIDAFAREEYFVRPEFCADQPLASFYARFYSRDEYIDYIEKLLE